MELLEALHWRYATRTFRREVVDNETVQELLETMRLAPSSYGLQPYRVIVVEDHARRASLLPHLMGQDKAVDCSHLLVIATLNHIDEAFIERYFEHANDVRGLDNPIHPGFIQHVKDAILSLSPTQRQRWAEQQAYIALGQLTTACALLGIDACPMGGFDPAGVDRVLGLETQGVHSTVLCPIGYRHESDTEATLPKVRIPLDEFTWSVS
ncbi:NAD(P)H-dependent oxidoreductase [Aestuariibacter halophilus]|uniref:NAD(P)H-dependent oxidoreductase n=1 Tax=Fluctibacter halophilus TaxID=226011 RepID=A0ABS8G7I8_9ALTE|nr:NAD(P)H-dependent oxidoreductase [Aestuariibacter halophilus]MCC2616091.1 NAD(P)H-dependent oxidoreductase [Aestuariibacter halophilus]